MIVSELIEYLKTCNPKADVRGWDISTQTKDGAFNIDVVKEIDTDKESIVYLL